MRKHILPTILGLIMPPLPFIIQTMSGMTSFSSCSVIMMIEIAILFALYAISYPFSGLGLLATMISSIMAPGILAAICIVKNPSDVRATALILDILPVGIFHMLIACTNESIIRYLRTWVHKLVPRECCTFLSTPIKKRKESMLQHRLQELQSQADAFKAGTKIQMPQIPPPPRTTRDENVILSVEDTKTVDGKTYKIRHQVIRE